MMTIVQPIDLKIATKRIKRKRNIMMMKIKKNLLYD